jgi:CMP-N,N'-diacetyllegionaminic acid synthase
MSDFQIKFPIERIKKGYKLALIPARGGSKRVKDKNIHPIGGKPLIVYTIEAAIALKNKGLIDEVIVSTDSEKIAEISKNSGANVPFLRPAEISNENSTEFEFHLHALQWMDKTHGFLADWIINLYPTTPFRGAALLEKAILKFNSLPDAHSLRSTKKVSEHPYKMWVKEGEYLKPFIEKKEGAQTTAAYHLLPAVQIQNASIYITKSSTLAEFKNTVGQQVVSFEMSAEESVDINDAIDIQLAEAVLKSQSNK